MDGLRVSANYFSAIGIAPALGRGFLPEEERAAGAAPVAVLSYGLWQRRFGGDPAVVGREITLNGQGCVVLGLGAAIAGTRVLTTFLYGVEAIDVVTFIGVAGLLGVVALLANYLPARRAARTDPIQALRAD